MLHFICYDSMFGAAHRGKMQHDRVSLCWAWVAERDDRAGAFGLREAGVNHLAPSSIGYR